MRGAVAALAFVSCFALAYSEDQTDWSGGQGVVGPVSNWGNDFYENTSINWFECSGALFLFDIQEQAVAENYDGASSVFSVDLNEDGFMDVLGAGVQQDRITWWENTDGSGTNWTEHVIALGFDGSCSVHSSDFNGDGHLDVVGAACVGNDITWWENVDGSGTNWIEHSITEDFNSVQQVHSEDINGDGYIDVLGAAYDADEITWWENLNGTGTSWAKHTICGDFDGARSVYSSDVDGDGYMDVLGAAADADRITWWENLDGSGTNWAEHVVCPDISVPISVFSEDIDGNGSMDVLVAACGNGITWWENLDGSGTNWTEHVIDGGLYNAHSVYSADISGDGYMDVVGAAFSGDEIAWWDNSDTSPGYLWTKETIDEYFYGANAVHSADVNGDGHLDILGAAHDYDKISWWYIYGYSSTGSLESSILDTQSSPDWLDIDWTSTEPPLTTLGFQVRSSNQPDIGSMGPWSDTLYNPCSLEGVLTDGDRYMQYRTILNTADPDTTPTLLDVTVSYDPEGIHEVSVPLNETLSLLPVTPNPCSDPVRIGFIAPGDIGIDLRVYDIFGRLVFQEVSEHPAGQSTLQLTDLVPGVYYLQLEAGEEIAGQRFVVVE